MTNGEVVIHFNNMHNAENRILDRIHAREKEVESYDIDLASGIWGDESPNVSRD